MGFSEIKEKDSAYIAHTYGRFDVDFVSGEGASLVSSEGKKYVDFGSGIAVNTFGACDPVWREAVTKQISLLQHASNLFYTQPMAELAKLLCERTGARKVFFGNSGAEANECAIKAARKYSYDRYGEGRYEILSMTNSFHGRTLATLTATGQDVMHPACFGPYPEGFSYCAPDAASVKKAVSDRTCAVLIEPVQGESGVNLIPFGEMQAIAAFCGKRDILLICDEVQTGNGRTGRLYAYQHSGVSPDIVTTAKGLAGGLPLGACLLFEKCGEVFKPGDHGSTFGGNPVACAGAVSILSRLDDNLLLEVQGKGDYLRTHLGRIRGVSEVTGLGLMIGIGLSKKTAREVAEACLDRGLVVLTAKNRVRLLPPLNVKKDEMDFALQTLCEVIEK